MTVIKRNFVTNATTELFLSFFIFIILALITGSLLNFYHVTTPPIEELRVLFISTYLKHLAPKPQERFVFISVVVLLPLLSIVAIKIAQFFGKYLNNDKIKYWKLSILSTFFLLPLYFYNSELIKNLIFLSTKSFFINCLLLLVTTFLFVHLIKQNKKIISRRLEKIIIGSILISAILFQTLSARIVSIYSVNDSWAWIGHFEAFFYSISQVVAGKTILADLPAQYGLYPELLKPIFSLIGLSIFKATFVMGILQILSLLCLFFLLKPFIKSSVLLVMCIISLCLVTGFTWRIVNYHEWDPYFAYYPLRFVFPCLILFSLSKFARHKNIAQLTMLSLLCAFGVIWNLDVGLPALGTTLIYISTFLIFPQGDLNRHRAIKFLLLSSAIIVTTLLLFFLYLNLKASESLNISDIFKYQKLFYLTGFTMLPIPKNFNIWQIIMGSYLFGLISFVYSRFKNYNSLEWDLIFWLSILGVGLFIYYEGRSHFHTLILVSWPAILLAFLFADKLFRLIRANLLPKIAAIATIPILFFGVYTTADYLLGIPFLYNFGVTNWSKTLNKTPTLITENINFIKSNLHGQKEAGIWLMHQGAYFAELNASSAIKGPGLIELVLIEDARKMLNQIAQGLPKILFVDLHGSKLPEELASFLKNNYTLVDAKNNIGCFYQNNLGAVSQ